MFCSVLLRVAVCCNVLVVSANIDVEVCCSISAANMDVGMDERTLRVNISR